MLYRQKYGDQDRWAAWRQGQEYSRGMGVMAWTDPYRVPLLVTHCLPE